ncbi:Acetylornithine/succinyldiaminopimelate/putrescine aminotransferase [Catalinimonas alkaloidigena]|uniref:Acetylornithine/succinyldiaminopimelate/putrescine aminotransferase n=1 Tax=Catalinimonas alkaloidigena TaxID=1075417 RepID=A0A1G8WQB3_9BACT|nr:aspartate aminotransferase family protein [Catalinimonas alkaloidigena]SDJ79815.1 Acetylornithine/succinyldiaminopimelate/putrescine aminotransferase [Catalinimonas alkaloidigena]
MIEVERAEGVYLYGPEGQHYIDLISGIGVSNVGHRHPRVVSALQAQLDRFLHVMVYGELVQSPQVQLAHKLAATLPAPLDNVYLVNSGSEAVEGAAKLAKRYTGRTELISCQNAYHGSSQGALSLSGNERFKRAYRPLLPGIRHIRHGNIEDLDLITHDTAAVFLETIQGEAGVRMASADYFQALRARCDETESLLILDEIQVGFGRTGKFWAFEWYNIVPDIVICAKGMGGGMPIGAFVASQKIMNVLKENPILGHITTFGGHPMSCVASAATIDVIQEEGLTEQVAAKEALFRQHLQHPAIQEIRGKGLLLALEFESFDVLKPTIDRALAAGILTDWFLYCDSAMRLAPPLTITPDEIAQSCQILINCMP